MAIDDGMDEADCVYLGDAGNDDDGEEKPVVPVKTVDKTSTRTVKRNAEPAPPARGSATGSRRGGPGGNEGGKFSQLQESGGRQAIGLTVDASLP